MTKYVIQVKKDPLRKEKTKAYPQTSPITPINLTSMIKKQIFKIVANQYLGQRVGVVLQDNFKRMYSKVVFTTLLK